MRRPVGEPATVAVMTGLRERKWFLGFGSQVQVWKTLPRDEGFRLFAERFLASPYPMVVVGPDFSNFDAQFNQGYIYLPFADLPQGKSDAKEREFLHRCIDRIRPEHAEQGEKAEVLHVEGRFVGDLKGGVGIRWTASFDIVARSAKVLSKQTCLQRIVPGLRSGIGDEEGGLYTPYGGEGIFHLLSI
jgi:hypothetical protein